MALFGKRAVSTARPQRSVVGTLFGWLGARELEKRVIADFPTWQEFSERKLKAAQERKELERLQLPPHKVYVSSPLHWNFMYLLFAAGAVVLAVANPQWAGYLLYGAIGTAALVALFVTLRDGLTFHLEGARLEVDGDMINARHEGDDDEPGAAKDKPAEPRPGLLGRKRTLFRSKLLQIHYQNILRTFESGNRRTWVYQDASIADIETLLSQRGMKLAWTCIEVLPQLGLLGTLVGMVQMFSAFRGAATPDIAILGGFAVALGTTVLANMFVLVLRPLHMRNERSMQEILSTLQMLMSMFILPTQQFVLERQSQAPAVSAYAGHTGYGPAPAAATDKRLTDTLERLAAALGAFGEANRQIDSGNLSRETATVAQDVRTSLRALREAFDPRQFEEQQRGFEQLTQALYTLADRLEHPPAAPAGAAPADGANERVEHDLMQLRMLTRDTLMLLDQIAGQLGRMTGEAPKLLTGDSRLRDTAFTGALPAAREAEDKPPDGPEAVRLFRERG
jgi:hypothetical protein